MDHRMMCSVCPDRKRVDSAKMDARRIRVRMEELLRSVQREPVRHSGRSKHRMWFDSHVRCRFTGGTCPTFQTSKRELESEEDKLAVLFDTLVEKIEGFKNDGNTTDAGRIQRQLQNLLRGHYPSATHHLLRG